MTVPGPVDRGLRSAAEFAISFLLVAIVLNVSNSRRMTRFTPWVAGFLVAGFISVESPLSGMSMNPARTVGSALPAGIWTAHLGLFPGSAARNARRPASFIAAVAGHTASSAPNITTTTTSAASSAATTEKSSNEQ